MHFLQQQAMPSPTPASRQHHIDVIKALAIQLVMVGHAIQFTQPRLYQGSTAFQIIYSFHMSLFFFVSGALASNAIGLCTRLPSQATTLLIPFVAWMPIYWLAERAMHIGPSLGSSLEHFLATFTTPSLGLWFLWTLFLIHLIHVALKATKRPLIATACTIAILAILQKILPDPEIFGLGFVKMYLGYFILGTETKAFEASIHRIPLHYMLVLIPIYAAAFLLSREMLPATAWSFRAIGSASRHIAAITAILGIYRIALEYPINHRLVRWLSMNTLAIYALHVLVLEFLLSYASPKSVIHDHAMFAHITTLAIVLPLILILKQIPFVEQVFFGRSHPAVRSAT